ncbi:MAG TPA: DUF4412 domain-containing protein [Bacteroidia bacterium]|nr:DUF4412 domain-containing protein [Bacteroidia bacterium]
MKRSIILSGLLLLLSVYSGYAAGTYLEYSISSEKNANAGSMTMYYQDGNSRSEMKSPMQQSANGVEMSFVMLFLKETPGKSYMLNTANKTYTEIEIKEGEFDPADSIDYDVTIIGKEKVNGYNCTHCIVKSKSSSYRQEMWTTTEIADFDKFKSIENKYTSRGMYKALREKGADGFPVRMKTDQSNHQMIINLVKAESREHPASLFSLDGYTKSASPAGSMMSPEQMKEMSERLKNMTPEERQKYIQQMMQQAQPHK